MLCTFENKLLAESFFPARELVLPDLAIFPVTKEFMASPQKVGKGLARHIDSKKFVICHSFTQAMQMKLCYRYPLFMGKMMWKMTTRAV